MVNTVLATREGLLGSATSSGYKIDTVVSFVALPNTQCLHRWIKITNPSNGKATIAQILDVGPWSEVDPYVFNSSLRPLSESNIVALLGKPQKTEKTNGAGIDLGERVWNDLGMKDNSLVRWEFIDEDLNK